jgi:(p)ppGpp synthase/HD superfamily hydrolase
MVVPTALIREVEPSFVERLPLTRTALEFALRRHAGQRRDGDQAPFVLHPLEVGSLLSLAGYADHVVAAGVLHDVLENTDADEVELDDRFGPRVSALVRAVSDDPSIEDERARKAALRAQVAGGPMEAAAIFAADKVSKARELRIRAGRGRFNRGSDRGRFEHYEASLDMLSGVIPGHPLVDQLRMELEAVRALPAGGI